MKYLVASMSVVAIAALSAGAVNAADTATETKAQAENAFSIELKSRANAKADSAYESKEFTGLAFPEGRGSKNFATVAPDGSNGNGSHEIPRAGAEQGGRDKAVFDTSIVRW